MKKLILSLIAVFLLASFTNNKNTAVTLHKMERNSLKSQTSNEGINIEFMKALTGDPSKINKFQGLKKPRTIL